jgi:hypothetical protein
MELSLQTFFDLGVSHGLGDDVFPPLALASPSDLAEPTIQNPLGKGIVHRLHEHDGAMLAAWRATAARKADEPDMELGYDEDGGILPAQQGGDRAFFKQALKEHILNHPIKRCEITLYAVGTVFLRLDFGPCLPAKFMYGFAHCFEYAAYDANISDSLLQMARRAMGNALEFNKQWWRRSRRASDLPRLSKRPAFETIDGNNNGKESKLLTTQGITHVVLCIDRDDEIQAIKRTMLPPIASTATSQVPNYTKLLFEYHGTLYFDWAVCVVTPRSFELEEKPSEQIEHILDCMQIAHSFLGTCQAFQTLVANEIVAQTGSYVKGKPVGRDPKELNRLRTLALAVVSLTDYSLLTNSEEDRAFFQCYAQYARMESRQKVIEERCGNLLGVVVAAEELKQEQSLM